MPVKMLVFLAQCRDALSLESLEEMMACLAYNAAFIPPPDRDQSPSDARAIQDLAASLGMEAPALLAFHLPCMAHWRLMQLLFLVMQACGLKPPGGRWQWCWGEVWRRTPCPGWR